METLIIEENGMQDLSNKNPIYGVITNGMFTNVLEKPQDDSAIIFCVPCLTEVMVEPSYLGDRFYKVCTASGIEGFCKKKFVSIRRED